jgi:hypothetical protein
LEPTSIAGRLDDVIMQYDPGPPVKPVQSFVACRFPLRGVAAADGMRMAAAQMAAVARNFMSPPRLSRVCTR